MIKTGVVYSVCWPADSFTKAHAAWPVFFKFLFLLQIYVPCAILGQWFLLCPTIFLHKGSSLLFNLASVQGSCQAHLSSSAGGLSKVCVISCDFHSLTASEIMKIAEEGDRGFGMVVWLVVEYCPFVHIFSDVQEVCSTACYHNIRNVWNRADLSTMSIKWSVFIFPVFFIHKLLWFSSWNKT